MANAKSFDENVALYDRYRPTYSPDLFADILSFAQITPESKILEIGCGTGNATLPFIRSGADVTAVELGENLAAFTREKFAAYPNFRVVNSSFERFETDIRYDLIFAATAFHWIPADFAYPRCGQLLNPGGVLAVFWNTPRISRENAALYGEIQALYRQYMPDDAEEKQKLSESEGYIRRCEGIDRDLERFGYSGPVFRLYQDRRTFCADDYVGLLHTYSDHMALPEPIREEFFGKIRLTVEKYGQIEILDTVDLHMGKTHP